MTEKYEVLLSIKAKEDLKSIVFYINNNLKEPAIAKKYAKIIKEEIMSLSYFPQRNAIITEESLKNLQIRKIVVKNYIIFYKVNEESSVVNIERILYGASNWMDEL